MPKYLLPIGFLLFNFSVSVIKTPVMTNEIGTCVYTTSGNVRT
jgi:hypothetical protein